MCGSPAHNFFVVGVEIRLAWMSICNLKSFFNKQSADACKDGHLFYLSNQAHMWGMKVLLYSYFKPD